ncbi:MAG: DUF1214 domain-containing protein [Pseudomonadota bacterium]
MVASDAEELLSGREWDSFCDQLKAAGRQVLETRVPQEELTRVEGFRYLTRLLRLSLEKHLEYANPDFPQFYSLSHETAKIGNDNPDNYYLNCEVLGDRDYLISGNVGSVAYLSIESKAGSFAGEGDMAPTGHVALGDIETDAEGNFELWVSQSARDGNWLPMTAASDNLLVRQTFNDRRGEQRAQLSIKCLNPRGSDQLEAAEFATQLRRVAPFVSGTAGLFQNWMEHFSEHINALPPNDQSMCLRAGGDPAIYYHNSFWQLAEHEVLVIEFRPPEHCRAWNFQLSNYWMESLDYRYHRISVNNHSAVPEQDGRIRILVTEHDPGNDFPNWLTTTGHRHGAMLLRYVEAQDFPAVSTRVISREAIVDLIGES